MHLEARDLDLSIDARHILGRVSLVVPAGRSVALIGPSGCGKTTLLNCLGLLLTPDAGTITVDGRDVTRLGSSGRRRFWRDHVAFVFQDYGLMNDASVGFNVSMATAPVFRRPRNWGPQVEAVLARVGLAQRASEPVARLSGGERERVGIARAMHKGADLILADEPTASLDAANRESVQSLLLGETERGASVVIATHDMELANACDAVLDLGGRTQPSSSARSEPVRPGR